MSKKYVIEIKPEYEDSFKGVMLLGAKDSDLYVDTLAVEDLEQYTPVDVEKIYDKAYGDGYKIGLNDAWKAARKINIEAADGGLSNDELKTMFDNYSSNCKVMQNYTAQEAINRIKAYESKRNAQADLDCLMHETGMTIDEIVEKLKELRK